MRLLTIPNKNRVIPVVLFFGSYGETNLGTENFDFFGGHGVVSSSLGGGGGPLSSFLGGGGGVEDCDGADGSEARGLGDGGGVGLGDGGEGCGLGDGGRDGG